MAAELERQFAGYKQRLAERTTTTGATTTAREHAVDDEGGWDGAEEEEDEAGVDGRCGGGDVRGRMYEAYVRRRDERLRDGWHARMERKEAEVKALWAKLELSAGRGGGGAERAAPAGGDTTTTTTATDGDDEVGNSVTCHTKLLLAGYLHVSLACGCCHDTYVDISMRFFFLDGSFFFNGFVSFLEKNWACWEWEAPRELAWIRVADCLLRPGLGGVRAVRRHRALDVKGPNSVFLSCRYRSS